MSEKCCTFAGDFTNTLGNMDDDLYTLDLFLLADDNDILAEKLGSVFMRFREIIHQQKEKIKQLVEALKFREKRIRELESELLYYRTHYPPPDQLALEEKGASPPDPPPEERVSIFCHTSGKGLNICREKLEEILTTSKTKSEVCQRLAHYEETYFNFNKHKNVVKARLLNQNLPPNVHFSKFTEADFKKYWSYAKKKNHKSSTPKN